MIQHSAEHKPGDDYQDTSMQMLDNPKNYSNINSFYEVQHEDEFDSHNPTEK